MTNGSDDYDYQRERREEMEAERIRQQRIREKVPGRRVNGKARAGDIDGACCPQSQRYLSHGAAAILDQIREEWEFVIDDNVSLDVFIGFSIH